MPNNTIPVELSREEAEHLAARRAYPPCPICQKIEPKLRAALDAPSLEQVEGQRGEIEAAFREQAAEYRREAQEQAGADAERLNNAADVVDCVTRIVFDSPEDMRRRVNASIEDPDSPGWAAIRAADRARDQDRPSPEPKDTAPEKGTR